MDLIVIPSCGRHMRQQTLWVFNKSGISDTYKVVVAVPESQQNKYMNRMAYKGKRVKGEVIIVPSEWNGISRTRQWILTQLPGDCQRRWGFTPRTVMMADDDLWFCHRPKIDDPYMPYINTDPYHMHRMIELLTGWLEMGIVHVGLISRQANRILNMRWQQPGRQMNIHAYDVQALRKIPLKWDRVPVMEDFDITLQLLSLGYVNRISCRYAWTQTSNSDGGCSTYRTADVQAAAAHKLAKLHPGVVKILEKEAKTWKNKLTARVDVRVRWLKAYTDSKSKKGYVPTKFKKQGGERRRLEASL